MQDKETALALRPPQVGTKASGFPSRSSARVRLPLPEEGQVPTLQVQAHGALESAALWGRWKQVDVRSLYRSRRLAHFALTKNGARLWTEGDATSTSVLKVHNGQTQVVRIGADLHLDIDTKARLLRQYI
eukprot:CAMPEP_0181448820 /NCGR_PEP_ID=MMETSP1110-20121109/27335_1 /TAXON_ID=174948 /ORGANISM="Symbiodinium sp., Strain CCMP421" /LENGTH=129 /DNA_ID=CAMNT_0023572977 /DNA_START=372 /DNA_END=762 /DNA_ORIENTATION=+